jgi:hypothetical protein
MATFKFASWEVTEGNEVMWSGLQFRDVEGKGISVFCNHVEAGVLYPYIGDVIPRQEYANLLKKGIHGIKYVLECTVILETGRNK